MNVPESNHFLFELFVLSCEGDFFRAIPFEVHHKLVSAKSEILKTHD